MAIVVPHRCGGGASPVGGCGLVRRALGAVAGTGTITPATPLKREAGNARPMAVMEDVTAAKRVEDLARDFDLALNLEHVPLGGEIDLNRPNHIVIGGPRSCRRSWARCMNPTLSSRGSRVEYDPATGEPVRAEPASPLYRHEET
ncbi:hypothetical protein [Streptosporangium roseum]|uniref:hypothetical protein n=1 Tax=Streptosporangium roseum TaxID=2001 RepID=UPI0012DD0934|nr:hypothetical protein [Streptosporangium roseum]